MPEFETEFLLLPRKIEGKWYWLKTITYQITREYMCIGGKITTVIRKKLVKKED